MERYSVFLDWRSWYCYDDHTTQGNLQIQYNPCQNSNEIFRRNITNNFKICMETQKSPNSQKNLEKKRTELEKSCCLTLDYTTKLHLSEQYSDGTNRHRSI